MLSSSSPPGRWPPALRDAVFDRRGRGWALNNQGRVHQLFAAHSMGQIDRLYGSIFEGILGERISTRPVEVVGNPFPPGHRR